MFGSPERSLKAFVQFSPLAVVEVGLEGLVKLWNPAAQRMFGWTEAEALGRPYLAVPAEDRAEFEDLTRQLLAGCTIRGKEVCRQRKDGRRFYAKLWAAPIHDEEDKITGITATFEDITEQKENERKLRESQARQEEVESELQRREERMRLAFEAAKIGCWDWNLETGEMVWSAVASKQMGLPEDSPTSYAMFVNSVHPDDRKAMQETIEAAIRDNKAPHTSYRMIWPDGSVHFRSVTGRVFHDKTGRAVRMLGVGMDVDDSKRADDRLQLQVAALQAAANAIVITDTTGTILWTNQAFSQLTGYRSEEALGNNPRVLKSGEMGGDFYAEMWGTITSGKTWHGELINRRKDGSVYTEEMTITPVRIGGREITHYIAIKQDVTSRKIAEDALRRAEEKYRSIFEDAVVGIFQTTPDGRPVSINRALARMHGYDSAEKLLADVANVGIQLFADPNSMPEFARMLEKDRALHNVEVEAVSKDGAKKWLSANVRAVSDASGKVVLHEGTVEDITERKAAEARVQFLAYYDALTGLPNRTLLRDRVLVALPNARRRGEKVALLFLDLDHFKTINDSLGHSIGDLLLKEVAERLKRWTREQDTVARLGGDEFLVLVNAIKETEDALAVAERVVNSMAAEFIIQGHILNVTCSLGISIFPDNGEQVEALFKNADLAMYRAKENGRNNFQLFTQEMNVQVMERMTLESSLRMAIERKEFSLEYQPQEDLATGEITGCEALIRWRHPELGLVSPNKFVPIAENSGLIGPIGEWVLRTACAQARQWQDQGLPAVPVAVNVSTVQFGQKGFVRMIQTLLRETGLAPQYLELELTESLLLSNADVMLTMLQELKAMGLKLSIDDFGTGYSSLSYLRYFPVYKLKIDRSFVTDVASDPDDAAITGTIISMAKSLGLKVLAEGVENEAQLSFLRAHHCDEIQGYYFSKPLPPEDLADRLRSSLLAGLPQAAESTASQVF